MYFLKQIGGYLLIVALGLAAFFSQRAKTAQAKQQLAQERGKIDQEYNATLKRVQQKTHDLSKKHQQEIKDEHKNRSSDKRDQLNNHW